MVKVAVLYGSNSKAKWMIDIERMLYEVFPELDLSVLVLDNPFAIENTIQFDNPIYNLLDRTNSSRFPNAITKVGTNNSFKNESNEIYDLLIDLSFLKEIGYEINSIKTYRLSIEDDNLGEMIKKAFLCYDDVMEVHIEEKTLGIVYSFIVSVDELSIRKTLHNLLHRLHFDFRNVLKGVKLSYHQVVSRDENHRIAWYTVQYLKYLIKRSIGWDWTWDILFYKNDKKTKISSNRSIYYADPFIDSVNAKDYIFLEKYVHKEGYAHLIVRSSIDGYENDIEVLHEPYHLSYPHIVNFNGKKYLIPESSANGTVDLYEFEIFPSKVKKIRTLLLGNYVDSTIIEKDGTYYLFTASKVDEYSNNYSHLKIFYSNDLVTGKFIQHPYENFVDPRFARQAGAFIRKNGTILRVTQDDSKSYGRKVTIFRVEKLTKMEYLESHFKDILPNEFNSKYTGCHTYNEIGDRKIVDLLYLK